MTCPYFERGVCRYEGEGAQNHQVFSTTGIVHECGVGGMIAGLSARVDGSAPCEDLPRTRDPILNYGGAVGMASSAD